MISTGDVEKRLAAVGFRIGDGDAVLIECCISDAEEFICNFCNLDEIPSRLKSTTVKYATGLYLQKKLASGDGFDNFDVRTDGVASISEGDTSITYDTSNNSHTEKVINDLLDVKAMLIPFRKLRW